MRKEKKARLLSMDELHARPCTVYGVPVLFHRWIEEARLMVTPSDTGGGYHTEVIRETLALVEFEDGRMEKVRPESIRFKSKED